jgi:hypothetical protein
VKIALQIFLFSLSLHASAVVVGTANQANATVTPIVTDKAIQIEVSAPEGTHLNFDGPWKLQVKGNLPLADGQRSYDAQAFDKTQKRFTVPISKKLKSGDTGEYVLAYFICNNENTWCKRAEATGPIASEESNVGKE